MTKTIYSKDLANKKINVKRSFAAPLEQVWQAWTDSKILDQWWAPRPWKAVTKIMDFSNGGHWLYYMEGPDGTQSWCRADYSNIVNLKSFEVTDCFCDENGNPNADFPSMSWKNIFKSTPEGTMVEIEITFASLADLEKIVEMGFKEGFAAAHDNLDELFSTIQLIQKK